MKPPLVAIKDLSFAYAKDAQLVLKNINLEIKEGEYIALIGQNGSGKTTLTKTIGGLLLPISGQVMLNGVPVSSMSVAERTAMVGYSYQNPDHQIFLSTIEDEVAFGPKNLNLDKETIEERVNEALEAVGLLKYRKEEPYFAGKGERQKVAVASILAMRSRLIILDEPTTGLDWKGSQDMMGLIKKLWNDGHTIIIITHNMRLVAENAQRAIVLCQGEILMDDSPSGVFQFPDKLAQSFLQPPQITQLWHQISQEGSPWLNSYEAQRSLNDRLYN
jgi:energy-coupling factor transport system ATP-binding protein